MAAAAATTSLLSLNLSGTHGKAIGGLAALLSDPIKFETGGADDIDQLPFEPINVQPLRRALSPPIAPSSSSPSVTKAPTQIFPQDRVSPVHGPSSPKGSFNPSLSSSAPIAPGTQAAIPLTWPPACPLGPGFTNLGNTCFLNATMQALVHTPPLVTALLGSGIHTPGSCQFPSCLHLLEPILRRLCHCY
jgi:Ubiquitin carboxyl-terminal hydrolase